MTGGRPLALLGLGGLGGIASVALAYRTSTGGLILEARWGLFWMIAAWWAVFALGAAALLRAPRRPAVALVVLFAVIMRLATLPGHPALSDDLYRYAWDGRVQAAGIDPYLYPPVAANLIRLRDPWLWPEVGSCRRWGHPAGCTLINRPAARTIYPPVAELWFRGVHAAATGGSRDAAWRAAALLVDLATLAVMLALLGAWNRDPRWLVLYAWSPVAVLETAQNGHVDGLAALLILLCLSALRRRPAVAGALLGAATLVKLYPALLLGLLVRRRPRVSLAGFAAVVAAGYLPHVLAVGLKVLGYLPAYLREERYLGGSRFKLLDLVGVSGVAAEVAAVVIVLTLFVLALRAPLALREPDVVARRLLGGALLLSTPVQPWYALALVAVAALGGAWWWLGVAAAAYPLYFGILVHGAPAFTGQLAYGLALMLVVFAGVRSMRGRGEVGASRRRSTRLLAGPGDGVELEGLEPSTSAMPWRRSPS